MPELCQPCGCDPIGGKKALLEKLTESLNDCMRRAAYHEAYPIALRMLDEAETLYGTSTADYASVVNDLASIERYLGHYDKSEKRFKEVAAILRTEVGCRHPEYATTLNNLAGLHRLTADYEQAEREFNEALDIYLATLEPTDWHTISCYNNLGLLYQDEGRYREALACHVKALELLQESDDQDDIGSCATTLMNGAVASAKLGDVDEANELLDSATALIKGAYGTESSAYASILNNAAAFRADQGDYEEAARLLEQSRDIVGRVSGTQSSAYRWACENLEHVKASLG